MKNKETNKRIDAIMDRTDTYQNMIAGLIRKNAINILDAIEYSNILNNKDNKWKNLVVEQVKNRVLSLFSSN